MYQTGKDMDKKYREMSLGGGSGVVDQIDGTFPLTNDLIL